MKYPEYAQIIIDLQNADFALRNSLIDTGQLGEGYHWEMEKLHNHNANELNKIITEIGFPTVSTIGAEASYSVWIIIQHSIGSPQFMKKCLKLLEDALKKGEADARNLAYLEDRIAVFENKPQLYGTQFDWDADGELNPNYFDEISKVNKRRKSVGLNTLNEQTEIIRTQAKRENHSPPKDWIKRKDEMEKWKKRVGWIL